MTTTGLDNSVLPKAGEDSAPSASRNGQTQRFTSDSEAPAQPFGSMTLPQLARDAESRLASRLAALPARSDDTAVAHASRHPEPRPEQAAGLSAWLEAGQRLVARVSDGIRKNIVEPIAATLENLRDGAEQFLRHPVAATQQLAAKCQNWWKENVTPTWERFAERCQHGWRDLNTSLANLAQEASDRFAKLVESLSKPAPEPDPAAKLALNSAVQLLGSQSSLSASSSNMLESLSFAISSVAAPQQQKLAEILVELGEALGKEHEREEKEELEERQELTEHTHDVVEELYSLRSDPRFQPAIDHVIAILRDIVPNYGDLACAGALLAEIEARKEAQAA